MAEEKQSQPWYNLPWVVATGSATIAGLIVANAGRLTLLWVGLAVVAFVIVGGLVWVTRGWHAAIYSARRTC